MFHASAKMQMHGTYGIFCHEGRKLSSQECIFIVYLCNTAPPSPMSDPAYLQNAFGVMVLRMSYLTPLRQYS